MKISSDWLFEQIRGALNLRDFRLEIQMSATDVPNWDSLHHVMLILEINEKLNIDLRPDETALLPDINHLLDAINVELDRHQQAKA